MDERLVPAADIDAAFVPCFRDPIVTVPVKDEAVLYEEDSGALHQLDPIATVVCGLFDGHVTLGQIVDDLVAASGADRQVVEADVLAFARDLGRKGLLVGVQAEETQQGEAEDGA